MYQTDTICPTVQSTVCSTHYSGHFGSTPQWGVHTTVCSTHSSDQYTLQCAVHTTVCNTHPLHPLVSSCSSGAQRLPIGNQAVHRQLLITPCETSYNVLCKHSSYRIEQSTQAATNHHCDHIAHCTLYTVIVQDVAIIYQTRMYLSHSCMSSCSLLTKIFNQTDMHTTFWPSPKC